MENVEYTKYVVTCKTKDCGNFNIAIEIDAPVVEPQFLCGVCSQQIIDFVLIA